MAKKLKKPVGKPKRVFTEAQVREMSKLALSGCQNNTIATIMGIPKTTLVSNFGQLLTKKRCERKYNLRKLQDKAAKKGNPALLIFLGKNELRQKDKQETELTGKDGSQLVPPTLIIHAPSISGGGNGSK